VTALRRTIAGLGTADAGKFLNYDGRPYNW
jgi:hypothetical protein